MTEINPIDSSKNLKIYKKDFARGSKVIKEASEELVQTTESHKQAQLKKSMKEALKAMNKIINNVLHEKGKKYKKKISKDLEKFINIPNDENMKNLNTDIKNIQKKIKV